MAPGLHLGQPGVAVQGRSHQKLHYLPVPIAQAGPCGWALQHVGCTAEAAVPASSSPLIARHLQRPPLDKLLGLAASSEADLDTLWKMPKSRSAMGMQKQRPDVEDDWAPNEPCT